MSEYGIKEWVSRSLEGDQSAFKEIVLYYRQRIFSFVFRMVCNKEDAEDIVQETFIRAWTFLRGYDSKYKFSTWLYMIAINCSRNSLKKIKPRSLSEEHLILMAVQLRTADLEQGIVNKNLAEIIIQLTQTLTPKQKLVFTLKCLEELETEEIKTITKMSADQIKNNLHLAKKNIREQINKITR